MLPGFVRDMRRQLFHVICPHALVASQGIVVFHKYHTSLQEVV